MKTALRATAALAAAVAATVMLQAMAPWAQDDVDVFLLVAVFYAVSSGRMQAVIMGALAGLTQDVLSSQFLGFHAFTKTAVAYLVGGLGSRLMLGQALPQFLALALATILDGVLMAVLASMAGLPPRMHPGGWLKMALVNGLVGLLVYRLVGRGLPWSRRRP
ncbi:MAG: rod shape-determining protein MreD [Acidobacteria bacterium]|nr:MAG: rod shape-determining protein MreD [Acidobacteriota bacterium]